MSDAIPPPDWGPPPSPVWAAGPPPPPPPPVARRTRRWPGAVGVAVAGVLAVAAVALVTDVFDSGPPHPDAWDARVEDLADFVEQARGLEFDHPVYVDFLSAAEYTDETTADEVGIGNAERADLDRFAGALRALGVASGELDLFAAFNQVADGGTLAFYDPIEQRVRVRGTELTVGLRVTIVHELTHALQDQHFDLERLYADELDSGEATAFRALIEGDALRVEEAYTVEALTADEQTAYDEEYAAQLHDSEASMGDVPPFVGATFSVPYALGQPFVVMLDNDGGNHRVDGAFDAPPDTEDDLFDPLSYLAEDEDDTLDLDLDDLGPFEDGPFGSPSWYLVLAERIDPKVAFQASLGWGGDQYAFFEQDDRVCVRAGFIGDTEADEAEMAAALETWAAAMPGGQAEAVEVDGHPGLESCDPGEDVDMALTGRAQDALVLPSLWGFLVADAVTMLDAGDARCYAHTVLDSLSYEELIDPAGTVFEGEGFQATLEEAFRACA